MDTHHADYAELAERGRIQARKMERCRWMLGFLSMRVEKKHGLDMLGQFAIDCNVSRRSMQQYHQVYAMILEQKALRKYRSSPVLSWSHFRIAVRLPEGERLMFLETCAANALTIEQAELMLAANKTGVRQMKVFEFDHVGNASGLLSFPPEFQIEQNKLYHIVIYASESIAWQL